MGLLRAGADAVGSVMADQWKEYFYCEAMDVETLVTRGYKKLSEKRQSSNTKGEDNIISKGSIVSVADGQCMLIVEQGKVVELCAEPGEFIYDSSTEPSIFAGKLGSSILESFKNIGKRFAFGGDAPKDQRVYYINTKEIVGNKYGTANPVPFRVVDTNIGLDMDIAIKCFGEYSYKIVNPIAFYTNVCGNVPVSYTRDEIDSQLKTELLTALQPAFAQISQQGVRYSALPGHTTEIADALNQILTSSWTEKRGLAITAFGVSSVKASEEDEELIKTAQRNAINRDPGMAAATLVAAQADAMKTAAANEGGAMIGLAGMNMAMQAGGMNAQNLFAMDAQQKMAAQQTQAAMAGQASMAGMQGITGQQESAPYQEPASSSNAPAQGMASSTGDSWNCDCGSVNTGKFCSNCGKQKPVPAQLASWTCSCGTVNTGNFCSNCGKPRG